MDPTTIATTWRLVLILAAAVICWAVYWDYRKKRLEFEERRLAIERGMTPPPRPAKVPATWPGVKQEELRLKYEERRLLIEKGMAVAPDVPKGLTRQDYLQRGVMATSLGTALFVTYVLLGLWSTARAGDVADVRLWCLGLAPIVLLYGVANLIYQRHAAPAPS